MLTTTCESPAESSASVDTVSHFVLLQGLRRFRCRCARPSRFFLHYCLLQKTASTNIPSSISLSASRVFHCWGRSVSFLIDDLVCIRDVKCHHAGSCSAALAELLGRLLASARDTFLSNTQITSVFRQQRVVGIQTAPHAAQPLQDSNHTTRQLSARMKQGLPAKGHRDSRTLRRAQWQTRPRSCTDFPGLHH